MKTKGRKKEIVIIKSGYYKFEKGQVLKKVKGGFHIVLDIMPDFIHYYAEKELHFTGLINKNIEL
jgi:hypothetical protein